MAQQITIRFGKARYDLVSSRWDASEHRGYLTIRDDSGNVSEIEAGGMLQSEMRQEIVAFAMREASR